MADSVHIHGVNMVSLPKPTLQEDRGLKLCGEPMKVLASLDDSSYYKNDRIGVDGKFDSIEVYLEDTDGNEELAPGIAVNYPNQSDATGFIVDWRQYTHIVGGQEVIKSGCYKIKVYYNIQGLTGYFYHGSYRLLPYSPRNAEGTVRIFVVLNDWVRTTDIDYTDSGFATTIRFDGKFGYRQPNYEMEDITETNRVTYKTRNESINTYELRSKPLFSCYTDRIDTNHLLVANQIFISDHNAYNHKQYFDLPVILDKEKSPELDYDGGGLKAPIAAYFKEKVKSRESKYNGNIQGSNNAILDLPKGVICTGGAGGDVEVNKSDGSLIANVTAPASYNVADSVISIAGGTINVKATEPVTITHEDTNGDPVNTSLSGTVVTVDDLPEPKILEIRFKFRAGDDTQEYPMIIDALSSGIITSITQDGNSGSETILINNVVSTAPFTLTIGDEVLPLRGAFPLDGWIQLNGTY